MLQRCSFLLSFTIFILLVLYSNAQDHISNEKFTLGNGLKVVLNSSTFLTGKTYLHLVVHSGSFNESLDERAAAHILNHFLFYNLRNNNPEVWKKLSLGRSNFGPDNNAIIHFHESVISFEIDQKDHELLDVLLTIIADWFNPDFINYLDPEIVLKDVTALDHKFLNGYKLLQQLHYSSTTHSTCLEGKDPLYSMRDFNTITPDAVKQYYHKFFHVSNATLMLSGSFHAPIVNMKIVELFSELPTKPLQKDTCQVKSLKNNKNQIHTIADSLVSISTLQLNYSISSVDLEDSLPGFDEYASTILNYWFRETILQNKGDADAGIIVGNVFINHEIKGIYTLTLQVFVQDKKFKEGIEFAANAWLSLLKNGFTRDEWIFISEYMSTLKQGREVQRNRNLDNKTYARRVLENYLNNRALDFNWLDLQEYDVLIQNSDGEKLLNYLAKFNQKAAKNIILAVPVKNKDFLPDNSYINKTFELTK
jgi:zinc protease